MARQTSTVAALTRRRVIEAAIGVFFERGIRAATLEDVATRAGVTRGAVYGHFSGKPALVAAIIDDLSWPLDIGAELTAYSAHPQPLRRLQAQLNAQITRCIKDPMQWQVVSLVLREGNCPTWPQGALDRAMHLQAISITDLGNVLFIAGKRCQLRPDIAPDAAARCLHAVGVGILADYASRLAPGARVDIGQCLHLFFEGIAPSRWATSHETA